MFLMKYSLKENDWDDSFVILLIISYILYINYSSSQIEEILLEGRIHEDWKDRP